MLKFSKSSCTKKVWNSLRNTNKRITKYQVIEAHSFAGNPNIVFPANFQNSRAFRTTFPWTLNLQMLFIPCLWVKFCLSYFTKVLWERQFIAPWKLFPSTFQLNFGFFIVLGSLRVHFSCDSNSCGNSESWFHYNI